MRLPFISSGRLAAMLAILCLTNAARCSRKQSTLICSSSAATNRPWPAAVQAARLGVKRIVLVNDIDWLGGQFSAEGVGCMDEWTAYRGKRVNFPR